MSPRLQQHWELLQTGEPPVKIDGVRCGNQVEMTTYDPEKDLQADEWLALDEAARVDAVEAYHQRQRIRLPNATLHATIHTVVENQIALGEGVVVETLARLRSEGLTRHEAVHAIGSVLTEQIFHALKGARSAI